MLNDDKLLKSGLKKRGTVLNGVGRLRTVKVGEGRWCHNDVTMSQR
jgi:hypothetical protein